MSLVDQSQQWYPTSVQVTVLQARSLRIKGKNGTNDAYAIMQVAKDKFSTSVAEKTVTPVWKEEATFELPLFHNGNTDNCTLHVHVMHRALMGPDKLLGQAVINLLELSEVKSHNKTEWYKLLDKAGKPDKERGEVLVTVQFMRNNITASMFDLSATDKPRSRLGKFKDKVRGKKKEGLSDSASAIVPSFTQVLTDSEEEGEANGEEGAGKEKKKKNKLKSLFSTKSNLQRQGLSQSMSVLGPLPEKNSSLSGSRSSGLNVDSSEGKKKFKFLTHKRTESSDSKASQGSLSLGRSKIPLPLAEQSSLCINGSHVYAEQPQNRRSTAGSTASSGHESTEDLRWPENSAEEEDEEEERGQMEEEVKRDGEQERKKLEEEERVRREEQEKKRTREEEMERLRFEEEERRLEEEEEERMRAEEEESRRKEEEGKRRMEEEEKIRLEEERRILLEIERMQRLKVEEEERMRKEAQERRQLEEKRREMEEQEKLEEEERMRRDEHERMKKEDRLRKEEEERKIREEEERLKREKEERAKLEEDRIRRKEEEERREDEERLKREKEAERRREEEEEERARKKEERLRREEEDRQRMEVEKRRIKEEERQKKEEERQKKEEERQKKEEAERQKKGEEERQKKEEVERQKKEEEERQKKEDERQKKEDERQKREEEEVRLRKEEEERLEVTQNEEAERTKLDEEREKEEKQRTLMEASDRLRLEQENKKKDEMRRQEARMREGDIMRKVQMEEVEKPLEYRREATVSSNPFEEVSSSPLSDDAFSNGPFEETPTVPVSCRTNKVSAVKPRPSSWGNPPQPCASSIPFLSSSSMDSLRGKVETRGPPNLSTDVRKMENSAPLPYKNQSRKDDSHIPTPNVAKMKSTKPLPPPRHHSSTSLGDGGGDQGSVTGPDHPSVRQNKDPALPPDSQRWASKDKWPSKSNCHSATLTQTNTTHPVPTPPRRHSATSLGSRTDHRLLQSDSKDQSNTRRDKHPAPLPPGRSSQAPSQTQSNESMTGGKLGPKKTVGASVSTVSQCVVQITPRRSSSADTTEQTGGGQSFTQAEKRIPSATKNVMEAKHNKGPAPSRPKYPPGKADMDKQSNTDEHDSSVEFDQKNPFAEDCRREGLCRRSDEQTVKTLVSTRAAPGPPQKSVGGDSIDLPTLEIGPAEDTSRTTSAKRVRAPLPPGNKPCKPREEEAAEQSCEKLQSSGAPTPNKLSSGVLVKTQNRGVGVALPCVIVAQSSSAPSPAILSPPHPEPLNASEGMKDSPTQTARTVSGQRTRLHGAPLSVVRQCSGEDAGGRGGRSASGTLRPHPVKPLNTIENPPASYVQEAQAGKTTEVLGGLQKKVKDTEVKGPYSQLTQEELISLVMKQQEQMSNRDNKIKELEQYIDNLLVRILDEHPSILMSMNSQK